MNDCDKSHYFFQEIWLWKKTHLCHCQTNEYTYICHSEDQINLEIVIVYTVLINSTRLIFKSGNTLALTEGTYLNSPN